MTRLQKTTIFSVMVAVVLAIVCPNELVNNPRSETETWGTFIFQGTRNVWDLIVNYFSPAKGPSNSPSIINSTNSNINNFNNVSNSTINDLYALLPIVKEITKLHTASAARTDLIGGEKFQIQWNEIYGLKDSIKKMKQLIIFPIKFPKLFRGDSTPWRNILLFGPSGAGKTILARAAASAANYTYFEISRLTYGQNIVSSTIKAAKVQSPAIVFIKEIETFCTAEDNLDKDCEALKVALLLTKNNQIANKKDRVIIIAGTSDPCNLNDAILQQFQKTVTVSLPDKLARMEILYNLITNYPNNISDSDVEELAVRTEGYFFGNINNIIHTTIMNPIISAKYFCEVTNPYAENDQVDPKIVFTPCDFNITGAVEKTWEEFTEEELLRPVLTTKELLQTIEGNPKPTNSNIGDDDCTKKFQSNNSQ